MSGPTPPLPLPAPDRVSLSAATPDGLTPRVGASRRAIWACWWVAVVAPAAPLRRLAAEPSLVLPTAAAALVPTLYSASILWSQLFVRHAPPSWEPWVSVIPRDSYYRWEAAFLVPWSLLLWVLFGALGHLFARALGGQDTFEATLAVFAFGLSVPLAVLMWLPDLLKTLADALWGRPFSYPLVALSGTPATLWALALSALGARIVQRLPWARAAVVAVVAMAVGYGPGGLLLIR
jgi:hypothetical protein